MSSFNSDLQDEKLKTARAGQNNSGRPHPKRTKEIKLPPKKSNSAKIDSIPIQPTNYFRCERKQIIGRGAFGSVSKSQDQDGNPVAVKRIVLDPHFKNRELDIVKQLDHKNCIKYIKHSIELENNKQKKQSKNSPKQILFIHMDYLPANLHQFFSRERQKLQKERDRMFYIRLFAYQLFSGLNYLHKQLGIAHRDIKPENILVDPDTGQLKICDFGSAKILKPNEESVSYIASRYYRAPELILGCTHYTTAIDIWAAGCVIAEILLKGKPLFRGSNNDGQMAEMVKILGPPTRQDLETFKHRPVIFNYEPYSQQVQSHSSIIQICVPNENKQSIDITQNHQNPIINFRHQISTELKNDTTPKVEKPTPKAERPALKIEKPNQAKQEITIKPNGDNQPSSNINDDDIEHRLPDDFEVNSNDSDDQNNDYINDELYQLSIDPIALQEYFNGNNGDNQPSDNDEEFQAINLLDRAANDNEINPSDNDNHETDSDFNRNKNQPPSPSAESDTNFNSSEPKTDNIIQPNVLRTAIDTSDSHQSCNGNQQQKTYTTVDLSQKQVKSLVSEYPSARQGYLNGVKYSDLDINSIEPKNDTIPQQKVLRSDSSTNSKPNPLPNFYPINTSVMHQSCDGNQQQKTKTTVHLSQKEENDEKKPKNFSHLTQTASLETILPPNTNRFLLKLLKSIFVYDVSKRPTAETLMNDDFFAPLFYKGGIVLPNSKTPLPPLDPQPQQYGPYQ